MINKIRMKNVASYKAETVLETDKKANLIYGLNGTGKSTVSSFLYDIKNSLYSDCAVEGLRDTDKLLVYNQQFIKDNFYETEEIQGIFTLSKENKAAKTIIENAAKTVRTLLEEQKKQLEQEEISHTNYSKEMEDYQKEIWKIKTEYTGGDRVLEYCLDRLKGNKQVLFDHIVSMDLPEQKPVYTVDDLKREAMTLQGDAKKEEMLSSISFMLSELEKSPLLSKAIVGKEDSTVSEIIDKLKNSDWVNNGLQYVRMDEEPATCPFCQQPTLTKALLKQLEEYFDESYMRDKEQLRDLKKQYDARVHIVISLLHTLKDDKYVKQYVNELEAYIAKFSDTTSKNIKSIDEKIKNPSTIVVLETTGDIEKKVNDIIVLSNKAIQEYNQKIDNKKSGLNEIKNKFWNLMRYEYDSVINLYQATTKKHNKLSEEFRRNLKKIGEDINAQRELIKDNQKKTVNIDEAVDNIKQGLIDIGITDFTIEKYSEEESLYRLKRENSNVSVFKTLSEGEKMVISFLYFVELCKGETRADATSTGKIIVIDDPISSLSHIYIFNIGRLIHNEFLRSERYEQIFVLTHSLYFFYELTCIKHDERKEKQKLFRLCKNSEGSTFVPMKYEEIQNDYQAYWHIVKDRTQPPALIANCMRNIMEYFFNFVEKQDFAQVFQRPELQEVRFAAFNRYMNRESHSKGQNIFDIKEFDYDSFRDAFKKVFEKEGYIAHYEKMMK